MSNPLVKLGRRSRTLALWGLLLGVSWGAIGVSPAQAEGSRELVQFGGQRPYTEWRGDSTGGIRRRTLLKVYANAGEVINFGSSAVEVSLGNAFLYAPNANVDVATPLVNCVVNQPGKGKISTRAQEIAGPLPSSGGYDPCTFTAPSTGIYQVVFYGPLGAAPTGGGADVADSTPATNIANPVVDVAQRGTVAMWDITVRSSPTSTTDFTGRVFTDYIALIMGANGRQLNSQVYILTTDGFRYRVKLNQLDPNGFIFYANSQGLLAPNGDPLYRSASSGGDNAVTPPLIGGVTLQPPVHKLFINPPDGQAIDALGISRFASAPPVPQNFQFVGGAGGSGNQTRQGVGGTFTFDLPVGTFYQLTIDTNNDGIYNPTTGDRQLEGIVTAGFRGVVWDGKDGNGTDLPPRSGNAPYNTRVLAKSGEYHFPLLDAESNPNGFTIEMLNPPGPLPPGISTTTFYFDERNYTVNGTSVTLGCNVSQMVCDGRAGINSAAGAHSFPTNYGDKKAIDTWIYFPGQAVLTPLVITANQVSKVQGRKSVQFVQDADSSGTITVGDLVEYTLTFSNLAPANSDAINFVIADDLPSQLTWVSTTIASQTAGNTITINPSYNGTGAVTNTGTLRVGDTIAIKITARVNSANNGQPIANQARATFNLPDNPTASTGTTLSDADSAGSTTNSPAVNGFVQQTMDDGINQGNDPLQTGDDEPTFFTAGPTIANQTPNLLLVKRITRINGSTTNQRNDGSTVDLSVFDDDPNTPDDNNLLWPTNYLQGAVNAGVIRSTDTIEYTIYFLSTGDRPATNINLCDWVPAYTTYVPNSMQLAIGNTVTPLTDVPDYSTDPARPDLKDRGEFFAPRATLPAEFPVGTGISLRCATPQTDPQSGQQVDALDGAVAVNVVNRFLATPNDQLAKGAYGFIRFLTKVK